MSRQAEKNGDPLATMLPEEKIARLELLHRVGMALDAEPNTDRLVEMILLEARQLCRADGGTLYLRTDEDSLRFSMMYSDSLGISLGGSTGRPVTLPDIPLHDPETGEPNHRNVATSCALRSASVNVPDAYHAEGFDFSGTRVFDARNGYRTRSVLCIPMRNNEDRVIGVLQLINARDRHTGQVHAFPPEDQAIVEALAAQAGIVLDNKLLLDGQKQLLESFIKMIAAAIDDKSPYTGGHCERVPVLAELLAKAACEQTEGPFADFDLSEEDWYELQIASWLHDCGKVVTPVHVMDKATKLEGIRDGIEDVRTRFELLRRGAELRRLQALIEGADPARARAAHQAELAAIEADLVFIEEANRGGEYLSDEARARIAHIGERRVRIGGRERPLLSPEEVHALQISRGTLTPEERRVINDHIVMTIKMLDALPFPRNLRRVPEYAGGHHEKMDGTGYPRGLFAGDMSVPARIMAVADVFEALTAQDRPYKPGKPLSQCLRIMGFMKRENHLDPDVLDLFVRSGVYKEYARRFLPPELIDEVDEDIVLGVQPEPFELPDEEVRSLRWERALQPLPETG